MASCHPLRRLWRLRQGWPTGLAFPFLEPRSSCPDDQTQTTGRAGGGRGPRPPRPVEFHVHHVHAAARAARPGAGVTAPVGVRFPSGGRSSSHCGTRLSSQSVSSSHTSCVHSVSAMQLQTHPAAALTCHSHKRLSSGSWL